MAVDHQTGAESDPAVAALIAAATAQLAERADISKVFVAGLFARAVPEDFLPYRAQEVAALAERAWSLFAIRRPGTSKIRLEAPSGAPARGAPTPGTAAPGTPALCSRRAPACC